jgi:hypothetical protein
LKLALAVVVEATNELKRIYLGIRLHFISYRAAASTTIHLDVRRGGFGTDRTALWASAPILLHGVDEGRRQVARFGLQARLDGDFEDGSPVVGKIASGIVEAAGLALSDQAIHLGLHLDSQLGVVSHGLPFDC